MIDKILSIFIAKVGQKFGVKCQVTNTVNIQLSELFSIKNLFKFAFAKSI